MTPVIDKNYKILIMGTIPSKSLFISSNTMVISKISFER
jgi:G:T/U-mismatch repair DNA glycosylase